MVLKIVNKTSKDICLPWGQWNYEIKAGGELLNPPHVVITAMKERYRGIEVCEVEEVVAVEEVTVNEVEEVLPKKKAGRPKKIKE